MAQQATNRPTQKVVATSLAGAVGTILIWFLNEYAGVATPQGVNAALVTVLAFAIGWLTPPSIHDQVVVSPEPNT